MVFLSDSFIVIEFSMPGIYIDIHTHSEQKNRPDVIFLKNIRIQDAKDLNGNELYFSAGIHPWDTINPLPDPAIPASMIVSPGLIAIGECGIDRLRGADIAVQTHVFRQHALMAEAHSKPLIIHCARAWQEIIALKNEIRPKVPWIIHGFRGKPELASQLTGHGFYLSFGEHILSLDSTAGASLKIIPIDRLFLETDVSRHAIEDIYRAAAEIKNISLTELQKGLVQNFEKVFQVDGTSRMASAD
jgi:TatD DNase family protein